MHHQRIYGFQALSFAPNQSDPSNLRQILTASIFREQGVPAPISGFVEITLDTGSDSKLLGLCAMTEIPDKALLDRVYGNNDGNLYKPDGRGAHLVTFVEESMHKKDNNEPADFTDVQRLINALHADRSDRPAWRETLGQSFDIETFIDTFAINQAIGNWDTYGIFAHNFYLYAGAGKPAGWTTAWRTRS